MKRQELVAEFDRLSLQLKVVKQQTGIARDELVALACQQLCVSICGSLEQSIRSILVEYTKRNSNSKIHRPIFRLCDSYQNPKTSKILDLIGLFDDEFRDQIRREWEEDDAIERQTIDNMVDDRITIAHRKKIHFQVGTSKLENYLKYYKSISNRIYDHFLNT